MTLVFRRVVDYVHLPVIVHPQLAHDDIVDSCRHFPPGVVVLLVSRANEQMGSTQRNNLQVLSAEFRRHAELLLHFPTAACAVLCSYRWMVTHLEQKTRN